MLKGKLCCFLLASYAVNTFLWNAEMQKRFELFLVIGMEHEPSYQQAGYRSGTSDVLRAHRGTITWNLCHVFKYFTKCLNARNCVRYFSSPCKITQAGWMIIVCQIQTHSQTNRQMILLPAIYFPSPRHCQREITKLNEYVSVDGNKL